MFWLGIGFRHHLQDLTLIILRELQDLEFAC
jgi:hypothetical protein